MKKTLAFVITIALLANVSFAQSQQLKTLHHLQGEEDRAGLTYTGYEDELGNIVRHGSFTYQKDGASVSLNYKNNKLDGAATITVTNPSYSNWKISCKMKYKEGTLLEINYEDTGVYEAYYKKIYPGKTIFKYSKNEQGLLIGDFECTMTGSYENEYIKGKFDPSGKATGYWTIYANDANRDEDALHPNRASFGEMGNKVYFEQGFCLGANENAIALGRKYLIEKSISEQEMLDQGFFYDKQTMEVKYGRFARNSSSYSLEYDTPTKMVSECISAMIYTINNKLRYGKDCPFNGFLYEIYELFKINYSDGDFKFTINYGEELFDIIQKSTPFETGSIQGKPITFMSNELYQNIVDQIKNGSLQDNMTPKYDENLHKYYLLKTDGKSRLYIPLEKEKEFEELYKKN